MTEQHATTTRPAWVLAAASILMMAWMLVAWSQSASADCADAVPAQSDPACADQGPWADAGSTP
jgi:hypothetical protein